jgi:HAE1 family hydrophobic/amphiphilic exporter-1
MFVELKPRAERDKSVDEVIASCGPSWGAHRHPDVHAETSRRLISAVADRIGPVSVHHAGHRHRRDVPMGASLEAQIRQLQGFEDVSSDLQLNNPQVTVEMDRDKLSSLGLTATQVENALYNAYGTRQVSQIFAPNNQYQVILRVAPEFQSDPAAMSLLYVRSDSGGSSRSSRSPG